MLTADQIARYDADGFLVLPEFVSLDDCARLRARANEIVEGWEPSEERSVFTTNQQERVSNGEFLASGASTWCFFEEEAFDSDGVLTQAKELSINKIGHAQHDTDDEFERFAYNPALGEVARDVGMLDPLALQSMYIFKQPRIDTVRLGRWRVWGLTPCLLRSARRFTRSLLRRHELYVR